MKRRVISLILIMSTVLINKSIIYASITPNDYSFEVNTEKEYSFDQIPVGAKIVDLQTKWFNQPIVFIKQNSQGNCISERSLGVAELGTSYPKFQYGTDNITYSAVTVNNNELFDSGEGSLNCLFSTEFKNILQKHKVGKVYDYNSAYSKCEGPTERDLTGQVGLGCYEVEKLINSEQYEKSIPKMSNFIDKRQDKSEEELSVVSTGSYYYTYTKKKRTRYRYYHYGRVNYSSQITASSYGYSNIMPSIKIDSGLYYKDSNDNNMYILKTKSTNKPSIEIRQLEMDSIKFLDISSTDLKNITLYFDNKEIYKGEFFIADKVGTYYATGLDKKGNVVKSDKIDVSSVKFEKPEINVINKYSNWGLGNKAQITLKNIEVC